MATPPDLIGKTIDNKGKKNNRYTYGTIKDSTIRSYGGDDTLTANTISDSSIDLGDNKDSLSVTGTITNSIIQLGRNKNTASFGALVNSTINGGSSSDTVTILTDPNQRSNNSTINLFGGNDYLILRDIKYVGITADGGAGTDTLDLDLVPISSEFNINWLSTNSYEIKYYGYIPIKNFELLKFKDGSTASLSKDGFITYRGTNGNDASLKATKNSSVIAGDGDDTIGFVRIEQATIDGGSGTDTVKAETGYLYVDAQGQWAIAVTSTAPDKTILKSVEFVEFGYEGQGNLKTRYELKSTGAVIKSLSPGGSFKSTSGRDTMVGTAGDDLFSASTGDVIDLSAGGKDDWVLLDYYAGISSFTVFGAKSTNIFRSNSEEKFPSQIISKLKYTNGFITSGQIRYTYGTTATIDVFFTDTKPPQ